jgi:CSLREA domain-containing protein
VERTLVVNTTADVSDGSPGDGSCDTGNVVTGFTNICTLRAALSESDVLPGMQSIHFSIPGGGLPTIRPRSILGNLGSIGPVIIDATTQPGGLVELNGSDAGAGAIGLSLAGEGGTVRGLVINGFASHGILISSTGEPGVPGGHLIEGSFIGTNATGTLAVSNGGNGVTIMRSDTII